MSTTPRTDEFAERVSRAANTSHDWIKACQEMTNFARILELELVYTESIPVCCQKFDTCEERCVPLVRQLRADRDRLLARVKELEGGFSAWMYAHGQMQERAETAERELTLAMKDAAKWTWLREHLTYGHVVAPASSTSRNSTSWRRWYHDTPILLNTIDATIDVAMHENDKLVPEIDP